MAGTQFKCVHVVNLWWFRCSCCESFVLTFWIVIHVKANFARRGQFLSATIKFCWNFVLQLVGNHGAHVIWKTLVRGSLARLGDIVSQITEMRNDRDSGQTSFDCRYWDLHILIFTWDFTWEDKNREEAALCSLKDSNKKDGCNWKSGNRVLFPKVPGRSPRFGWPSACPRMWCATDAGAMATTHRSLARRLRNNSIQQLTWRIWSQNLQIVFVWEWAEQDLWTLPDELGCQPDVVRYRVVWWEDRESISTQACVTLKFALPSFKHRNDTA